ncbi:MAG: shikimate dehydrogenase [Acetobacteraceae bacterium]|nr:shikimate dehydrogenase [Acetobacteraceae bacterium]
MITGNVKVVAHIGYPTGSFKAPMIYNPWFEAKGVDAVVVPLGVKPEDFRTLFPDLFRITTVHGALITMPHKVTVLDMVDEVTPTAQIAGSSNAILKRPDGSLLADMFDGAGFVRGVERKGRPIAGSRALVVGAGGVGSAIAASIAAASPAAMGLFDVNSEAAEALAGRLRTHYPAIEIATGSRDPAGYDLVVNATPLGMKPGDPLPFDPERLSPSTFVGEVVMKEEYTPLLRAAQAKGCPVQVGTDMLFEMIPSYLEFFGFGTSTAEELRSLARL